MKLSRWRFRKKFTLFKPSIELIALINNENVDLERLLCFIVSLKCNTFTTRVSYPRRESTRWGTRRSGVRPPFFEDLTLVHRFHSSAAIRENNYSHMYITRASQNDRFTFSGFVHEYTTSSLRTMWVERVNFQETV